MSKDALVEATVAVIGGPTQIDEVFTLEELTKKDQKHVDALMAELNKKEMTEKEWTTFFAKIMKDVRKLKNSKE